MSFTLADANLIRLTGFVGSAIIFIASLCAALVYRGRYGQPYSPFNHFISELGEMGVSRLAWLFNVGLILGGVVLLPCCLGLGLLIPGIWSKLALAAGCVAVISIALVGVFPMNNLKPHTIAAMTYFRAGLVMVILFTLAVALQSEDQIVVPKAVNWAGMLAVLAYASFLLIMRFASRPEEDILQPMKQANRPSFWLLPAVEWAIFFSTIVWFAVVGFAL